MCKWTLEIAALANNLRWKEVTNHKNRSTSATSTCEIQSVRRRPGERLSPNRLRGAVKHGGGNITVWGCMSAGGVGRIFKVEDIIKHDQYWFEELEKTQLLRARERKQRTN